MFCISVHALLRRLLDPTVSPEERRALVLACVMQSCAWVEGFANDVCEQSGGNTHLNPAWLPAASDRARVAQLRTDWESRVKARSNARGGVGRWRDELKTLGLVLAETPAVDDMQALVDLRNHFAHAEPMIYPTPTKVGDPAVRHELLIERLQGRFDFDHNPGTSPLPHQVLSVACGVWACSAARAFCLQICKTLGEPDRFAAFAL